MVEDSQEISDAAPACKDGAAIVLYLHATSKDHAQLQTYFLFLFYKQSQEAEGTKDAMGTKTEEDCEGDSQKARAF